MAYCLAQAAKGVELLQSRDVYVRKRPLARAPVANKLLYACLRLGHKLRLLVSYAASSSNQTHLLGLADTCNVCETARWLAIRLAP